MDKQTMTGREFGKALCRHFGIPTAQCWPNFKVNTHVDDILSVTVTISLTAADLAGIAQQIEHSALVVPQPEPRAP